MQFPDLTKRSNAIVILLGLEVFFFVSAFIAWLMEHGGSGELWKLCAAAFYGNSQALMLALKMGGPDAPELPAVTSGSVQTTTTSRAESVAPAAPAPDPKTV